MKKKALWTDIFREIWWTKARFLSIFAIIMLGVGFFAGIKATGPDMLNTAEHYFKEHRLMDLKVQSTYGLREKDIDTLRTVPEVSGVQPGYSADVFLDNTGLIAKVFSYSEDNSLNQYKLISGRMPQATGEIVIDEDGEMGSEYKLGDTITFTNPDSEALKDTFKTISYKVVGTVKSPMFINNLGRGSSSIGKGTADVFVVIPQADFNLDIYTEAYLTFKDAEALAPYTPAYDELIEQHKEEVEQALEHQPEERLKEIKKEGQVELDEARLKITDAKQQLADARKKLADAKAELDEGRRSYQDGVEKLQSELAKGRSKLDAAQQELEKGKADLERNRTRITEGKAQLKAGQAELDNQKKALEPKLAQGQELVSSLKQIAKLPPGAITEERKSQLVAAAGSADEKLGQVVSGYFSGAVDAAVLNGAVGSFEQGLNQASGKLASAQQTLDAKKQQLDEGQAQLLAGERKLEQGQTELDKGRADLAEAKQKGEAELASAKKKLEDGQAEYEKGRAEYQEEKQKADRKIADAEKEIADGQKELDELELPKTYVLERSTNPGYTEFGDNADRLSSIATAFPVFFFLIAALVSLTTMTRMVEEHRLQIGTLKALGYSNGDIMKKFLVYATLASVTASAAGLAVGYTLFPTIIFNAYGSLYNLTDLRISFYPSYSIISIIVALVCTTMTALIASRVELRSNASVLMRPRAPKSGQRILLERVGFIWKRLNFTGKVTARNLFRYKQRMFMTVLGVAGCAALILAGFGMKDSIGGIAPLQFGKIMKYNAAVAFHDDSSEQEKKDYDQLIANIQGLTGVLNVTQDAVTATAKGVNNQEAIVFVPESPDQLSDFILLNDRKSGENIPLTDQGAVITEKLARLYGVGVGDNLTIQNNDNDKFDIKIADITENYTMHYLYMTPSYYKSVFGDQPEVNAQLLTYKDTSEKWEDAFGEKLIKNGGVAMVNFTSGVSSAFDDTMGSMNVVVVVLIVSAAALAFVVLYNLTNINVSERIRELSTIKVLGFYDKEVTMYIYRENMFLTVLGIFVGNFLGIWLHSFVLKTAEVDAMMFSQNIKWMSYGYAAVLTLLFSGIVMLSMHYKLKRIDMIEALKSVE
ncbi:ABC transporter permease [Paenibacillus dakarensis]|uniref:ABC transporter permease n=1 Tax=Paenibacillus dakarensis TaxID=1527293 RepID=UPI000A9BCAE6|nr:ABC transporter permease [Paenibacillus dakarensis]